MKTLFRLITYFLRYKWRIVGGLLAVTIMSLADTASALLIAKMFGILQTIGEQLKQGIQITIDLPIQAGNWLIYHLKVTGRDESFRLIVGFAVITTMLILIKAIFIWVREYLMSSVQQKVLRTFRTELFDTIVFLPVKYFDVQKTGSIMSRLTNDVQMLEQSLYLVVEIAQNIIYTTIFATALFFTNWQLTIFTLVIFTFSGMISRRFGDKIRFYSRKLTDTVAETSAFLQEKISSMRIVKSFTREEYERKAFKKKADGSYHYSIKTIRVIALLSPTTELFNAVVTAVLVIFTAYLFVLGSMTMELMFQFLLLVNFLAKPVKSLGEGVARVQKTLVSAAYIFDMLDLQMEDQEAHKGKGKIEQGVVEFKNVTFNYNPEVQALKNVSFKVNAGESVALVGYSGSGKTTIVNLIPRFYEVINGAITIDGVDTREMNAVPVNSSHVYQLHQL